MGCCLVRADDCSPFVTFHLGVMISVALGTVKG